jgi:hypothetical protein
MPLETQVPEVLHAPREPVVLARTASAENRSINGAVPLRICVDSLKIFRSFGLPSCFHAEGWAWSAQDDVVGVGEEFPIWDDAL